ncbi:glutathione S-transferase N-terminal domain-containing protein [Halodesulfurarchaeum sp. HSR-GB]|uniref:glutathione S-transferase N-terminal domain-containing protein n=1 Tax=Halodesulfurarchaeum sp. HSR-GB TaxID=3074077 RepID=UPI002866BD6C|nr:glutathione S-transferase N-terminal domain-containing protein [Halodesulfurarchaeum sp. HSR-GB]MDR5656082.1 glutathione S-transferase N-terminal domain-containing protein [Halodesulfurarchaeum sp. HSR-GB]
MAEQTLDEPASVDTDLTLYRLQGCPFCERVVRTLEDLDVSYHSRFVEAKHSERNVVQRLSGNREVPVIVDHNTGVTMGESPRIVKYLYKTYRNRGGD